MNRLLRQRNRLASFWSKSLAIRNASRRCSTPATRTQEGNGNFRSLVRAVEKQISEIYQAPIESAYLVQRAGKVVVAKDKIVAAIRAFNEADYNEGEQKRDVATNLSYIKASEMILSAALKAARAGTLSTQLLSSVRNFATSESDHKRELTDEVPALNKAGKQLIELAVLFARDGAAEPWLVAAAVAQAATPLATLNLPAYKQKPGGSKEPENHNKCSHGIEVTSVGPHVVPSNPPAGSARHVASALLAAGQAGYVVPTPLTAVLLRLAVAELSSSDAAAATQAFSRAGETASERSVGENLTARSRYRPGVQVGRISDRQSPTAFLPLAVLLRDSDRVVASRRSIPQAERSYEVSQEKDPDRIFATTATHQQQQMVVAVDGMGLEEATYQLSLVADLLAAAALQLQPWQAYQQREQERLAASDPASREAQQSADEGDSIGAGNPKMDKSKVTSSSGQAMARLQAMAAGHLRAFDSKPDSQGKSEKAPPDELHEPCRSSLVAADKADAFASGELPWPLESIYLDRIGREKQRARDAKRRTKRTQKRGKGDSKAIQSQSTGFRGMNLGYPKLELEVGPAVEMLMRRASALAVKCASMVPSSGPAAASSDPLSGDVRCCECGEPEDAPGTACRIGTGTPSRAATDRGKQSYGAASQESLVAAASRLAMAIARLDRLGYTGLALCDDRGQRQRMVEARYPLRESDVRWHAKSAMQADSSSSIASPSGSKPPRVDLSGNKPDSALEALATDWTLTRHLLGKHGPSLRHREYHWADMHAWDIEGAKTELLTAAEGASVATQLCLTACQSIVLQGFGRSDPSHPVDGYITEYQSSQVRRDAICGLLYCGGSLGQGSNSTAMQTLDAVNQEARRLQALSIAGERVDPSAASVAMVVLAREQLSSLAASGCMLVLDELTAEGIERYKYADEGTGSGLTGLASRAALQAALYSSWALACQLDALAASSLASQVGPEASPGSTGGVTEDGGAAPRGPYAAMDELSRQAASLRSRLSQRVHACLELLDSSRDGIIAAGAAGECMLQRDPVPLRDRQRAIRAREVAYILKERDILSGRAAGADTVLETAELAATRRRSLKPSGLNAALGRHQGRDDASTKCSNEDPFVSEALHNLLAGTCGTANRVTGWPKGSLGTVAYVCGRSTMTNSYRLTLSLARPADGSCVGLPDIRMKKHVGKQLAFPPRPIPAISALDAVRLLWCCALLESTSATISSTAAASEGRVLAALAPLLVLRLHGPLAESELCLALGIDPPRDTAGGLLDEWGYDLTRDIGRRGWVVEDGLAGEGSGILVRPGVRLEAGALEGVMQWVGSDACKVNMKPSSFHVLSALLDRTAD